MIKKLRFLYGILIIVMVTYTSYASTVNNEIGSFSGLQLMKQIEQEGQTKGEPLLLFSNIHISGIHFGNIYLFEGETKIDGIIDGSIYVYRGYLYIGEKGIVKGDIKTLSTNVVYHQNAQIEGSIEPMIPTLNIFRQQWEEALFSHYTDDVPFFILELAKIVGKIVISLLFLSFFKRTIILQGNLLINQTKDVLYRGFVVYLMGIALILIFTLSLVGFPFALFLLLISWIISGFGETALALLIGEWVIKRVYIQEDIYIKFWMGIISLQLMEKIPVLGECINIIFIPVLSLGMFVQILANKLLGVTYAFIEDGYTNDLNPYNQEKLYEVITKNLKGKGRKE